MFVPALASRPISALATSIIRRGVPIFMIHRMDVEGQQNTGITPMHLRRCLRYLTEHGYAFVSLEEVILSLNNKIPLPEKAVAFTMDDGFSDQGEVAAPIFIEHNCPLTFFVITGLLDEKIWPWDAQVSWIINNTEKTSLDIDFADEVLHVQLGNAHIRRLAREQVRNALKEMDAELIPDLLKQISLAANLVLPEAAPSNYKPLSWDMARELEGQGVRFAPHSMSHRILSKLRKESSEEEITGSWEALNRELSNPLKVFCYPTGRVLDFGPREIDILKRNGFLGATSTVPGYVELDKNPVEQIYRLPRFELPDNMTDFVQYCSWIERAKMIG